ncbi:MAG TPA: encapsulin-associated ferritin-like protein [Alphaproteobacteria bacterium]|nr:encapsulin-associated ferritin-like protein [Alphaproteobacteria bacterium]
MADSTELHEDGAKLSATVVDLHRALVSLQEELEAVDWYNQRVQAAEDDELREILAHNRDEEKEHAAMLIEWLRRKDASFDQHLKTYLDTEGSIVAVESSQSKGTPEGGRAGSLDLAGLRLEVSR